MTKQVWKPVPIYTVSYRGKEIHKASTAREALARIPADERGWKILCSFGDGKGQRTVFDGTKVAAVARREDAA